jgi:hypothetical protein
MKNWLIYPGIFLIGVSSSCKKITPIEKTQTTLHHTLLIENAELNYAVVYYTHTSTINPQTGDTLDTKQKAVLYYVSGKDSLRTPAIKTITLTGDSMPHMLLGWFNHTICYSNKNNDLFLLNLTNGKVSHRGDAVWNSSKKWPAAHSFSLQYEKRNILITLVNGNRVLFDLTNGSTRVPSKTDFAQSWCGKYGERNLTSQSVEHRKRYYLAFEPADSVNTTFVLLERDYRRDKKADTLDKNTNWLQPAFLNRSDSCDCPVLTPEKNILILHSADMRTKQNTLTAINMKGRKQWSAKLPEQATMQNIKVLPGAVVFANNEKLVCVNTVNGKLTEYVIVAKKK